MAESSKSASSGCGGLFGKMIALAIVFGVFYLFLGGGVSADIITAFQAPPPDKARDNAQRTLSAADAAIRSTASAGTAHAQDRAYQLAQEQMRATQAADQAKATAQARILEATQQVERSLATEGALKTAAVEAIAIQQTLEMGHIYQTQAAAEIAAYQTQVAGQAARDTLELQRQTVTNQVNAWLPIVGVIAASLLVGYLITALAIAYSKRPMVVAKGNHLVYSGGVVNPGRATGAYIPVHKGKPAHPPANPDPDQHDVTNMDQKIEAVQAIAAGMKLPASTVGDVMTGVQPELPASHPDISVADLPGKAPWQIMSSWPGGAFPLGLTAGGDIVKADQQGTAPHLLVAGTTHSGKTDGLLRPVAAEALASGWQVIFIDRGVPGFGVFHDHPNAHIITLQESDEAIDYLKRLHREMKERLRLLVDANQRTWLEWTGRPRPMLMIVIDEYSNLSDEVSNREELWRWTRILANEARKAGILLVLALQDPTARSIDLRIRRNCTPVAFKVLDAAVSRVVLNEDGAERLVQGQFLVKIGGFGSDPQHAVAFCPSDDEIMQFFASRPRERLPRPDWLDAEIIDVEPTQPVNVRPQPFFDAETRLLAEQIREEWGRGASRSEMARAAGYPQYGGSYKTRIDNAIKFLQFYASTPSTDIPPVGRDGVEP
ncbi:MAG TPA: FtsK/SpoIIIE domain-containing protein [Dissulfurispiraceae bacterium]|nr:FtsK/SpoIIIE domain-containing protein [Dissulfurispiraceae bacterium]